MIKHSSDEFWSWTFDGPDYAFPVQLTDAGRAALANREPWDMEEIAGALAENLAGSAVAGMDATDRASLEWAREFIDVHAMPDNAAAGRVLGLIDRLLVELSADVVVVDLEIDGKDGAR